MLDLAAPRFPLGFWPTPLHRLERLGAELGVDLWIKRDDLSGLACGGNKVRKLEYLLGAALRAGADCVVTGGSPQSNHSRQTAAAAAVAGLGCHLALGGEAPDAPTGNLLLDELCGAQLHWCGAARKGETIPSLVEELRSAGHRPWLIPYGGSDPVGALGFVRAARELREQADQLGIVFDELVFASSSGGTHAGLLEGARRFGLSGRVRGMAIDPEDPRTAPTKIVELTRALGAQELPVLLDECSLFGDYGELTTHEASAIRRLARAEGVILDPVYTGRAFAGLLRRVEEGTIQGRVLFWHTGGTPALFTAKARDLLG